MSWNKKKLQRWFRVLHRDIGYLAVGITLVSGNFRISYGKRQKWIFETGNLVDGFGYYNCIFVCFY